MEKLCKSEIYDECGWGGGQPRLGSGRVLGWSPSRGNILDVKGGLSLKGRRAFYVGGEEQPRLGSGRYQWTGLRVERRRPRRCRPYLWIEGMSREWQAGSFES